MHKLFAFLLVVCVAATLAYPAEEAGLKEDVKLDRHARAVEPTEHAGPAPKSGLAPTEQALHHGGSHPPPHH